MILSIYSILAMLKVILAQSRSRCVQIELKLFEQEYLLYDKIPREDFFQLELNWISSNLMNFPLPEYGILMPRHCEKFMLDQKEEPHFFSGIDGRWVTVPCFIILG